MNETEIVFASIFAFAIGYGLAHTAKNARNVVHRWGILSIFYFVTVGLFFLGAAAMLTDLRSTAISLALGLGFIIKMLFRKA